MQRLVVNGAPVDMLEEQYRMHPDIAFFIFTSFYNSRLINDPLTSRRPSDYLRAKYGTSSINPYSLTAVHSIVQSLLNFGFAASSITVIVYYSAQVKLAARWLQRQTGQIIRVHSVDGAQGKQAEVML